MNRTLRLTFLPLSLALLAVARGADAPAPDEVTTLRSENKQLSTELATAWKELDVVKGDLAAAQATAAKAADDSIALKKQLEAAAKPAAPSDLQDKLDAAMKDSAQSKTDLAAAQATAKNYSDEIAALKQQLADIKAAAPAPAAAPDAALQKENEQLKADLAAAKDQLAAKPQDLAAAPAAAPAPAASDDTAKDLADTKDKLGMALHSYTLLQDENAQLKTQLAQADSDKANAAAQLEAANATITSLKAQAELAKQVDPLRTQLRQTQDELASVAATNADLRTKLALSSPMSSSLRPTPIRPGTAAAELTQTPLAAAAPAAAPVAKDLAAAPAADAAPRTYVVAEGDTLSRISKKFYGTTGKWEQILNANRDVLKSDKSLKIGLTLKIP